MSLFLLTLSLAIPLALATDTNVYYVKPMFPVETSCPPQSNWCSTLDAIRPIAFRTTNEPVHAQLVLLPGTHEISENFEVDKSDFPDKLSVTLTAAGHDRVTITCKPGVFIRFLALRRLKISGITIENCGSPDPVTLVETEPLRFEQITSVTVTSCRFSIKNARFIDCGETRLVDSQFQSPLSVSASSSDTVYSFGQAIHRKLSIVNCLFQPKSSRALHIVNPMYVNITNSLFESSQDTSDQGGGIMVEKSKVFLNRVIFRGSVAQFCGAIHATKSLISATAVVIQDSLAGKYGAICAVESSLYISHSLVTNNTALRGGAGALFAAVSNVTVSRTVFSFNTGYDGGAVSLKARSRLITDHVAFYHNNATHSGGAVYAEGSRAFFQETSFRHNTDPLGMTIAADSKSVVLKAVGGCTNQGSLFNQCRLSRVQSTPTLSGTCNSFARMRLNEGYRPCVYRDSLGIPTIGIGFNLRRSGARGAISAVGANYDQLLSGRQCLTANQIRQLFNQDMATAVSCAQRFVGSNWNRLGETRQSAVADMAFNLGCPTLQTFRMFQAALQSRPPNYSAAVRGMRDSLWCRQVGLRCGRNVACMSSG